MVRSWTECAVLIVPARKRETYQDDSLGELRIWMQTSSNFVLVLGIVLMISDFTRSNVTHTKNWRSSDQGKTMSFISGSISIWAIKVDR